MKQKFLVMIHPGTFINLVQTSLVALMQTILVATLVCASLGCETSIKEKDVKPQNSDQTKSVEMNTVSSGNDGAKSASSPAFGANFVAVEDEQNKINGVGIVELRRVNYDKNQRQFTRATLLPGRGMNVFQLEAFLPGRGEVKVIDSPSIEEAEKELNVEDPYGNLSFKHGGAILLPFANRIRGQVSNDKQKLSTSVAGHKMTLAANWLGKLPTAEPHAMHGLILRSKVTVDSLVQGEKEAAVEGTLKAGDFGVKWPSKMEVKFRAAIHGNVFALKVTAKNFGQETAPIGIGWHPYFAFPSGDRTQVKLVIPGSQRAIVNNYDDVFPTGQSEPTKGKCL